MPTKVGAPLISRISNNVIPESPKELGDRGDEAEALADKIADRTQLQPVLEFQGRFPLLLAVSRST
jgi:hypothetical protein